MSKETEGAEDAPVENDAMGGNVGIISPYPVEEQPPTGTTGGCTDCNVQGIAPLKADDAICMVEIALKWRETKKSDASLNALFFSELRRCIL